MELCDKTLSALLAEIERKEISCHEVMLSVLKRIDLLENRLNAYITVSDHDYLLKEAEKADSLRSQKPNEVPKFLGLPMSVKDIICTKGVRTTCASKILHNFIPNYDATIVSRVKKAGFIILGKTNCDEFAMGSTNENSFFGPVKNPWNLDKVAGGSSGGSAAAIAAGEGIVALGTDTGGSIRFPSSLCGVVGIKPTYGRVSRYGITAYASSFDQAGPICKSVKDAATILQVISGKDPLDSTSVEVPVPDFAHLLKSDIKGLKLGIPKEYFIEGIDDDVKLAIDAALKLLKDLGAEIVEISLPLTQYAIPTYYILVPAEASSNLARYDGVKYGYRADSIKDLNDMFLKTRSEGFGFETKKRIMLGTFVLSAGYYGQYYANAQKVRQLFKEDFQKAFAKVDAIVTPVSPSTAPHLGEIAGDPLKNYLNDIFTSSVNLAGLPAISICCGFSRETMPIGLQLIGNFFEEEKILNIAQAYEQATPWQKKRAMEREINL